MILAFLLSIILFLFFHPLYNNYTSLMSTSYAFLYDLWILYLSYTLCHQFLKITTHKKTIYSLTFCFIIGSLIPYKNHPFLHVSLPMVTIILSILLIAFIIKEKQKNEPFKAHLLNQWYFYGLSVIAMSLILFGQINGIVEILTLTFIFLMLSLLQH